MIFKADNILRKSALLLAGAAALVSCQKHPVFESEGNCDDIVEVYLKYDYNIQRADMRPYHVGWATVYALDQNGKVAATAVVSPQEAADKNSTVKFQGLQPGRYNFMAVAMQKPYDQLAAGKGARFRATFPQVGDPASKLDIVLDRKAADADGLCPVDAPASGLDTLWVGHSIAPQGVLVPDSKDQVGSVHRDTVSLVRDTKYLHLTLHQTQEPANIYDTMFDVRIVDANGHMAWTNELVPDQTLLYTPFAAWTTALSEAGVPYYSQEEASQAPDTDPIVERAAHFDISFGRLMYYAANAGENAELQIYNKQTGERLVRVNLPYYLSFGRSAYATHHYSSQEYLDREYDYHLDFFLKGGQWDYLVLNVNILPWTMRFQNEILD